MRDYPELRPHDVHNQVLGTHVAPEDWINPTPVGRYHLVVIGAGTAGLVTAAGAAGLGAKVALIERRMMGGDCLNVGCVPSKGLLCTARMAAAIKRSHDFGLRVPPGVEMDFAAAMERMRRLRASISPHDSVKRFSELGIDVYLGQGRFVDRRIEVAGQHLDYKRAVIATGARASAPPITGLDAVAFLTNETLFSLTELPKCFGIIGAGPIGCEMAQAFARFGSRVSLVEAASAVLPREDPDAAEVVAEALKADGVRLFCDSRDLELSREVNGGVRMQFYSHGRRDETVDQLLVAVGRAPNVEGLGLESVGVDFTEKGVVVNDRLQTTNPKIYAAGDICSPYQFTHAADFMARIVIGNTLFKRRSKASKLVIPWSTYTEPEVAHVGLSQQAAAGRGIEIDTFTQPLSGVDRAILNGETEGFVKVHVAKGTDKILGATIVAGNAGDMISEITLAMTHNLGLKQIGTTIHPYPTQTEAIRKVADLYNRTRLTPLVKSLMDRWLSWTR